MREGDFNKNTITILYKRAGEHCCLCKKITTKPHSDPEKFHNLGEAAHIQGLKNGPNLRFNPNLTINELKNARNGIWLCQTCHHIIDNDEITYTVEKLNEIKKNHENLIAKIQESGESLMPILNNKDREIRRYQKMITEMESEIDEKEILYSVKLNEAKFALSTIKNEREFLSEQLNKIKAEIIDLDNEVLQKALLEDKDIPKALEILDESKLDYNEMKLARSRVLRARLLISTGERKDAELNFERAFQIWPHFPVAIEYVQLLYFKKLDYTRIIDICEQALTNTTINSEQIILLEQIAMAHIKIGNAKFALDKLMFAKDLLKNNEEVSAKNMNHLANIEKHIGDCFKLLGNLQSSLKSYELSLNLYFQIENIDRSIATEKSLSGLATAIGLLYEANNDEAEGLIHHLRALEVLENTIGNDLERALINLNLSTCYLKKKNFDSVKAKEHALTGVSILSYLSKNEPMEYLEYLIGGKCMLADINFASSEKDEAESLYQESLRLANILYEQNEIFLHTISHIKYNYSVFLILGKGEIEKGLQILDDSISNIKDSKVSIFEYVTNLSQALFFKAECSNDLNTKMAILNEILDLTENVDPGDKSILWRIKAQYLIDKFKELKEKMGFNDN